MNDVSNKLSEKTRRYSRTCVCWVFLSLSEFRLGFGEY